jgi:hypothetical protein
MVKSPPTSPKSAKKSQNKDSKKKHHGIEAPEIPWCAHQPEIFFAICLAGSLRRRYTALTTFFSYGLLMFYG